MSQRVALHCKEHDMCMPRHGTIWRANSLVRALLTIDSLPGDYELASELMLTIDPAPEPGRQYFMVKFDDRPGALEMHYAEDLEFL